MHYKTIEVSLSQSGLGTLTLSRPEVHNAFGDAMIAELNHALEALAKEPTLRVLTLKSSGKNFSAGADLNWMRAMAANTREENLIDAGKLADLMQRLDTFPVPTLALVKGAALGGALGLIACCDIALAEPEATFCLSEVKIGLVPAIISPYLLRAIGERACRRYFLSAERFDALSAQKLGLVHEVSEPEGLESLANSLITQLLQNSPQALRTAKNLLREVHGHALTPALITRTSEYIADIRVSPEGQEGLSAFLEKRPASWQRPKPHGENVDVQ